MENEINGCFRETDKMAANFDFFHMNYTGHPIEKHACTLAVSNLQAAIIFPIE